MKKLALSAAVALIGSGCFAHATTSTDSTTNTDWVPEITAESFIGLPQWKAAADCLLLTQAMPDTESNGEFERLVQVIAKDPALDKALKDPSILEGMSERYKLVYGLFRGSSFTLQAAMHGKAPLDLVKRACQSIAMHGDLSENTEPMARRRFPPPWRVVETPGGWMVQDANGLALAFTYGEDGPRGVSDNRMTKDEARRIAAGHRPAAGAARPASKSAGAGLRARARRQLMAWGFIADAWRGLRRELPATFAKFP
jgi:hypothetical protein